MVNIARIRYISGGGGGGQVHWHTCYTSFFLLSVVADGKHEHMVSVLNNRNCEWYTHEVISKHKNCCIPCRKKYSKL